MTIEFPPFVAHPISLQAVHRLVAMACMLALVLLGLTLPIHSHAADITSQQTIVAATDGGDHCPGPTDTSGSGHCHASSYSHACCILLVATRAVAPAFARTWVPSREFRFAAIVTAPNPRPPARLVA